MSITLESLLTLPAGFGLTTASPVQRAICRCFDGAPLGDLANDPDVVSAFGGWKAVEALPTERPLEAVLLAAIRSGKSLLAACLATHAALTCDCSGLRPGEVPRISIVSLTVDSARPTWEHLRSSVQSSPTLRPLLVSEPLSDSLLLRHPTGRAVEIAIVAAHRASAGLVARWSGGVIFEEAARMCDETQGEVNLDEMRRAILGRLLPGCMAIYVSSPWATGGSVYGWYQEAFGKPSRQRVVIKATGPQMNPSYWTPRRCEDLRTQDPTAYRSDVMSDFVGSDEALLDPIEVNASIVKGVSENQRVPGTNYAAAIDLATRADFSVLTIAHREYWKRPSGPPLDVLVIDVARCWSPSFVGKILKAKIDVEQLEAEIAEVCKHFRITKVHADSWSFDTWEAAFKKRGLKLVEESMAPAAQGRRFQMLATRFRQCSIRLLDVPELAKQCRSIRILRSAGGTTRYASPERRGSHDDFPKSLSLLCEAAVTLPVSGGNVSVVQSPLHWDGSQLHGGQRRYFIPNGDGTFTSEEAPEGSADATRAQIARLSKGIASTRDIAELGEEEVMRRIANGGMQIEDSAPAPELRTEIEFPISPIEAAIGRSLNRAVR